jgi:biopolymer transport protein ExbB/TolQ
MNIVEELLKVALLGSAWVLYLLLGLSVISIGLILERAYFFVKNGRGGEGLREAVTAALESGDDAAVEQVLRGSGTVEGRVVATGWAFREGGARAVQDGIESELTRARHDLEKGSNYLGTVGNNAPFIGLAGTVIGVIDAFQELGSATARNGAMGNVMSGIAEALVATGVGLFVALPAVIAYNVVQARIGKIEQDALGLGRFVSAWLETRAQGGKPRLRDAKACVAFVPSQTDEEAETADARLVVAARNGGE